MKKIVCFCAVAFAMVVPAGVYASNVRLFDNPPQRGTTTVDESCRAQGVTYDRYDNYNKQNTVNVSTSGRSDVNMIVERKDGSSYSKDTRSNWNAAGNRNIYEQGVNKDDNVNIKCYPRNQK
jgi:hypothetical protein